MARVKRLVNHDRAFIETMKSPVVRDLVQKYVDRIAAAAGPGHDAEVKEGRTRIRGTVTTASPAARRREARDKTLTRAGHSARS